MIIPIGDEPNLPGRPIVTYLLIGLNVAIFVLVSFPLTMQGVDPRDPALFAYLHAVGADSGVPLQAVLSQVSAYDLFVFEHGFKPAAPSLFDLFASMFLHAGWLHLAGNMLFLWIYGDNVELQVGRLGYLAIYLFTGVCAVALHAVFRLDSAIPMVGASGAISGVLGCYFLWFPRNTVRVLFFLFFFVQVIRLPARIVLGFYLVVENLLPFLLTDTATGVAYGAHLGGFFGGLGAAAAVTALRRRQDLGAGLRRARQVPRGDEEPEAGAAGSFSAAMARGRYAAALELYVGLPARERLAIPAEDVLVLADWLVNEGQLDAGLALLQRFIATHPRSAYLPRAHLRAAMIHLRLGRLPPAYQHFLTVLDLDAAAEEQAAARSGLAEVERREREAQRFRLH